MIESEITAAAKSMRDSCIGARRVKTWSSGSRHSAEKWILARSGRETSPNGTRDANRSRSRSERTLLYFHNDELNQ